MPPSLSPAQKSNKSLVIWAFALGCTSKPAAAPTAPAHEPAAPPATAAATTPAPVTTSAAPVAPVVVEPKKVELHQVAMGTGVTFVAFTNARADETATRAAMARAFDEMRRLEGLMSEWRDDSEIGRLNANAGDFVTVSPETLEVVKKGLWAGELSRGVFDITFQAMSGVWKFGSASEREPKVPTSAEIEPLRKLVDYRRVEVDEQKSALRIGKGQKVGLGGIAKGYIVDRAVRVLRDAGLDAFLVQAGGDLYGAGKKPDGSPWVSGIQDPRQSPGTFFASIALEDHAFSTAGDYARSYVVKNKRYHHIIDPRTGYPATACRSVTIWAPDAFIADAVDDIVFILGPKQGLPLVESLDGVGAVIVDAKNQVIVSQRLQGRVRMVSLPTDGI